MWVRSRSVREASVLLLCVCVCVCVWGGVRSRSRAQCLLCDSHQLLSVEWVNGDIRLFNIP